MPQCIHRHTWTQVQRTESSHARACPVQVLSFDSTAAAKRRQIRQKTCVTLATAHGPAKYGWKEPKERCMPGQDNVDMVSISDIKRPLQGTRTNDAEKVGALMESIKDVGLIEPIDILLVEGKYYGFSGCHRFEACQRLGHEKILAKIRKANRSILQMHFR